MARRFVNASGQYFVNSAACPISGPPFTLACWARADSTADKALLGIGKTGSNDRHLLYDASSQGVCAFSANSGTAGQAQSDAGHHVSTTGFTHCVGVWASDSSRTLYHNGTQFATNTTTVTTSGLDRIYIGAYYANGVQSGFNYSGDICEVGAWNVALTTEEIVSLSLGRSPLLVRPGNLVGYWPLHARETNEEDWIGTALMTNTNSAVASPHARIVMPMSEQIFVAAGAAPPSTSRPFMFATT